MPLKFVIATLMFAENKLTIAPQLVSRAVMSYQMVCHGELNGRFIGELNSNLNICRMKMLMDEIEIEGFSLMMSGFQQYSFKYVFELVAL